MYRALADVPIDAEHLRVALDVGHAKANGYDWRSFLNQFEDRILVCHLHDNDGTGDHHALITDYHEIVDEVPAEYLVFEMKSVDDVARCVGQTDQHPLV